MQSLFEWDFYNGEKVDLKKVVERNVEEFAPGIQDAEFVQSIVDGVLDHQSEIDDIISKAAPEWPIAQIAPVDRNVLRVGLFELLFGSRTEVPPKVAINEAIELAKSFGGDSSGRFVNGVLGTIYRELGEPGKEEMSRKKFGPVDLEKLPKEELGGAIVFRKNGASPLVALVHDVFGYWTFSKGHLEAGEDLATGTEREIREELGVEHLQLLEKIGENEYIASDPETGPTRRHVTYYIAETPDEDLKLESSGGLDDARWFEIDEIKELKMYDDIKPILQHAIDTYSKRV
jgi:N utilization substance protein B